MERIEIKAERISPFGVLFDGKWYNYDKKSDVSSDDFTKGKNYTVQGNEGKNGAFFITKIVSESGSGTTAKKESKPEMTKEDWQAKDTRIKRSGLIQAAVQAVAKSGFANNTTELVEKAVEVAEGLDKWVVGG